MRIEYIIRSLTGPHFDKEILNRDLKTQSVWGVILGTRVIEMGSQLITDNPSMDIVKASTTAHLNFIQRHRHILAMQGAHAKHNVSTMPTNMSFVPHVRKFINENRYSNDHGRDAIAVVGRDAIDINIRSTAHLLNVGVHYLVKRMRGEEDVSIDHKRPRKHARFVADFMKKPSRERGQIISLFKVMKESLSQTSPRKLSPNRIDVGNRNGTVAQAIENTIFKGLKIARQDGKIDIDESILEDFLNIIFHPKYDPSFTVREARFLRREKITKIDRTGLYVL